MTEACPRCGYHLDGEDDDDALWCSECSNELDGNKDECEEGALCAECNHGQVALAAIEAFEDGEIEMALETLASHSFHRRNIVTDLITEADYYARRGDFEEAQFRLRCASQPKFESVEACKKRYDEAMAAKCGAAV